MVYRNTKRVTPAVGANVAQVKHVPSLFKNQLPSEWNKDTHLLEDSSELCVVVVLEVERVGDVEVEGRGQQQQERRGVHSASNERRLARLESEVGGPPVSSGGGGGARATGDVTSASKGPQFDPVLTIYKQPP